MSGEGLTEAEQESLARELFAAEQCDRRQRQALDDNWRERLNDSDQREYRTMAAELAPFIERILADRLAAVQAERDDLMALATMYQRQIKAIQADERKQEVWQRAESGEAERDAALAALDRVNALAANLHAATEGPLRVGTALWPEFARDAYSLAIEEAQSALRAAVEGGAS